MFLDLGKRKLRHNLTFLSSKDQAVKIFTFQIFDSIFNFFLVCYIYCRNNIYIFFFEPRVFWNGLRTLIAKLPDAFRKRGFILSRAAARPAEIRKWFK